MDWEVEVLPVAQEVEVREGVAAADKLIVGLTEIEGEPLGEFVGVEVPLMEGLWEVDCVPEPHLDALKETVVDNVFVSVWEMVGVMDWVEVPELLAHPVWVNEMLPQAEVVEVGL